MIFYRRSIGWILFSIIVISCSKSSVKFFSKNEIASIGVDSSLIRYDNFVLEFGADPGINSIKLKYLGSGGYYFSYGNAALLVDPFFSPYKVFPLALNKINTQAGNVEKGLADIKSEIYENVDVILNTHSHYDHLMDIPYVFNHYIDTTRSSTKIYGSSSMTAIVKSVVDSAHVESIDAKSGSQDTIGEWIYINGGSIRIMPIQTRHAPHYKKLISISLYGGEAEPIKKYNSDNSGTRVTDWREGNTYAYLIDFIESGAPSFRIYLLSSASSPPDGFVHSKIINERKIDLAILGAASFANVENYPQGILQHLQPDKLIIAHWEDLFKPYLHDPPRLIRATDFTSLIPIINEVYPWKLEDQQQFFMPAPGVSVELQY